MTLPSIEGRILDNASDRAFARAPAFRCDSRFAALVSTERSALPLRSSENKSPLPSSRPPELAATTTVGEAEGGGGGDGGGGTPEGGAGAVVFGIAAAADRRDKGSDM